MPFSALVSYIWEKYRQEETQEAYNSYLANLVWYNTAPKYKSFSIKKWHEIMDNTKEQEVDTRTGDEIYSDVFSRFES